MDDWHSVAQTIPGPATEEVGAMAKKANAYVIFGLVEESGRLVHAPLAPVRVEKKVRRNDPCPCGSGKKYKHCCLKKDRGK